MWEQLLVNLLLRQCNKALATCYYIILYYMDLTINSIQYTHYINVIKGIVNFLLSFLPCRDNRENLFPFDAQYPSIIPTL